MKGIPDLRRIIDNKNAFLILNASSHETLVLMKTFVPQERRQALTIVQICVCELIRKPRTFFIAFWIFIEGPYKLLKNKHLKKHKSSFNPEIKILKEKDTKVKSKKFFIVFFSTLIRFHDGTEGTKIMRIFFFIFQTCTEFIIV